MVNYKHTRWYNDDTSRTRPYIIDANVNIHETIFFNHHKMLIIISKFSNIILSFHDAKIVITYK